MEKLKIRNLSIRYDDRDILRDVSISFSGGLNYVVGLNGSGKTSLLKSIIGLIPYEGIISWDARDLAKLTPRQRAQNVTLLSQQLSLPFRTSVYDFVLMGRFPYLNWLGNYGQQDHQIAEKALQKMNLLDFRHRSMNELSGGEFQRANLARALCQDSPVLLLDEPAQSLDPKSKAHIYALIESLASDHLVICATHDLDYIKDRDARFLGINNEKKVWDSLGLEDLNKLKKQVYGIE